MFTLHISIFHDLLFLNLKALVSNCLLVAHGFHTIFFWDYIIFNHNKYWINSVKVNSSNIIVEFTHFILKLFVESTRSTKWNCVKRAANVTNVIVISWIMTWRVGNPSQVSFWKRLRYTSTYGEYIKILSIHRFDKDIIAHSPRHNCTLTGKNLYSSQSNFADIFF